MSNEKINVYEKMQSSLNDMREAIKDRDKNDLDSVEESEYHRQPLEITLYKEIKIGLSWGGPADGFKLRYYQDELQGGVYYFQDWGTYNEEALTQEEAQEVEDYYLFGSPEEFLNVAQ